MPNIEHTLAENNKYWSTSEKTPDGDFNAKIRDLKAMQIKGVWKLIWTFQIANTAYRGNIVTLFNDLEGENIKFTKRNFRACGFDLPTAPDMLPIIRDQHLVGEKVEISLSTKNGFQNVYLKRRVSTEVIESFVDLPDPVGDVIPDVIEDTFSKDLPF